MANGAQACIDRLIAREKLPQSYRRLIDACWRPLAAQIASWRREAGRAIVVGVNGGQGSGKTTLCRFLEECLFPELGLSAVTVALDDFYLPKADRAALAGGADADSGAPMAPRTRLAVQFRLVQKTLLARTLVEVERAGAAGISAAAGKLLARRDDDGGERDADPFDFSLTDLRPLS